MTNVEWLRSLSDEQLLDWLCDYADACVPLYYPCPSCDTKDCRACWSYWMKKEAKRKKT